VDPKKCAGADSVVAGQPIRESRDSTEHPTSIPVVAIFDVTGSMGTIPRMLQTKLNALMDVVIGKAGIEHPQVLVGAVGDATCDTYPFQVGQFESDNRFDEQLRALILEGHGGAQDRESYALAHRFLAYHTATDAWDKRFKKGYAFTIGDEMPWPTLPAEHVAKIFGVPCQVDETVERLIAEARKRWHIYHLHANDGSYHDSPKIIGRWKELLGEALIVVDDSKLVCEVIAGIVHSLETAAGTDRVISDIGLVGTDAVVVRNAISTVTAGTPPLTAGPPQPGRAALPPGS
jgi:hypothetical protein